MAAKKMHSLALQAGKDGEEYKHEARASAVLVLTRVRIEYSRYDTAFLGLRLGLVLIRAAMGFRIDPGR